ncbi:MAG TPA: hypothetical protein VM370_00515 [Candidatus Thermoplasmatota archaeon]|nr:hypothetical protein [Candidatus Thermoplasmatota archaeon]
MRALVATLLALAFAGCSSPAETPTSPATTGATPTVSPAPGAAADFEPVHIEHDFAGAGETKTFEIPAGAGLLDLRAFFSASLVTGPQNVCGPTQTPLRIQVLAPDNTSVADITYDGQGVSSTSGDSCGSNQQLGGNRLPAGTWKAVFEGTGQGVKGVVDIVEGE